MNLDIYLLNAQDLFIFLDHYKGEDVLTLNEHQWQLMSTSFKHNKELRKIFEIAEQIKEQDPAIIALTEVGGKESLENFAKLFLDNQYEVYHLDSNSDRGIDTGFLCKKDEKFSYKLYSHNKNPLENSKLFSRGLLELRVKLRGSVECILLLTHLKSKLDLKKEDFEGRSQRKAEVNEILRVHKLIKKNFPKTPILILGDLNGIIYKENTEAELCSFAQNNIFDILELINTPTEQRATYFYFNKQHNVNPMQLDYILIEKQFKDKVDSKYSKVLRFDEHKYIYPPRSIKERNKMPSDHLAYRTKIQINT